MRFNVIIRIKYLRSQTQPKDRMNFQHKFWQKVNPDLTYPKLMDFRIYDVLES